MTWARILKGFTTGEQLASWQTDASWANDVCEPGQCVVTVGTGKTVPAELANELVPSHSYAVLGQLL